MTKLDGYYTYAHLRGTDNGVFYIGKGRKRRVNVRHRRSDHWYKTVLKHGLVTQPLARWKTEQEAYEHEKFLIWCFRDMGIPLVNKTEGGLVFPDYDRKKPKRKHYVQTRFSRRGIKLVPASPERRKRMSEVAKGRVLSPECKMKISESKKGVKFTLEHRQRMSESAHRKNENRMVGVSAFRDGYKAQLKFMGKLHYLGLFNTPEDARAAYLQAKKKLSNKSEDTYEHNQRPHQGH